jgi:hypothetical protein
MIPPEKGDQKTTPIPVLETLVALFFMKMVMNQA